MKTFHTPFGRRVNRVALYARVSSKSQEDNTSLANQLEKTRAFAMEHGFEVVIEKWDVVTGKSRWTRTGFNALLELANQKLIDAILVDVADRLGRGQALSTLIDQAHRFDNLLIFADVGRELNYIEIGVGVLVSGAGSDDIGRRTREGRLSSIRKGGVVFSMAPYGYTIKREYDPETGKKTDSWVEKDPDRAKHVEMMFQWVLEGKSIHSISNLLHDNQILRPRLAKYTWDTVPGGKARNWARSTIQAVLTNQAYTGRWFYNRTETKRVEGPKGMQKQYLGVRNESEWECLEIEPIIDENTFNQVQAILKKNKKRNAGRRPKSNFYLLRGLVFCPCGRGMLGEGANNCYRCNRATNRTNEGKCHNPRLNRKAAEELVWRQVVYRLIDPNKLFEQWKRKREEDAKDNRFLLERIEGLQTEIGKAQLGLDGLVKMRAVKDITDETFQRNKKSFEATIKENGLELATVRSQLKTEMLVDENEWEVDIAFRDWAREQAAKVLVKEPTFEEKREILLRLDVKVYHLPEEKSIRIEAAFPVARLELSEAGEHTILDTIRESLMREKMSYPSSRIGQISLPFTAILPLQNKPKRKPFTELLTDNQGANLNKSRQVI